MITLTANTVQPATTTRVEPKAIWMIVKSEQVQVWAGFGDEDRMKRLAAHLELEDPTNHYFAIQVIEHR